jgi:3-phytase
LIDITGPGQRRADPHATSLSPGPPLGRLIADVEGLTLYLKPLGKGYLLASSQGNSTFAVYDRALPHAYRGSFRIVEGRARPIFNQASGPDSNQVSGPIDGVSETDGIDITSASLGPGFERGLFMAQDGENTEPLAAKQAQGETKKPHQNFKIVPWSAIAEALGLE